MSLPHLLGQASLVGTSCLHSLPCDPSGKMSTESYPEFKEAVQGSSCHAKELDVIASLQQRLRPRAPEVLLEWRVCGVCVCGVCGVCVSGACVCVAGEPSVCVWRMCMARACVCGRGAECVCVLVRCWLRLSHRSRACRAERGSALALHGKPADPCPGPAGRLTGFCVGGMKTRGPR